jgi:RimJ/RimL family protein N-acetyltransferase
VPTMELVELEERHLDATYRWISDQEVRWGIVIDRVITPESHRSWFAHQKADTSQVVYAVMAADDHVGNFGYRQLNPQHATGDLWMYMGNEFRGRSLGGQVLQKGLEAGFGALQLRKISLSVRIENTRAVLIYARAGFRVEGVLHAEQLYQRRPVDMLRMGLLRGASNASE